jgi:hypothetical protein
MTNWKPTDYVPSGNKLLNVWVKITWGNICPNQMFFISMKGCQNINVKNDVNLKLWVKSYDEKKCWDQNFPFPWGNCSPRKFDPPPPSPPFFLVITFSLCLQIENSISFYISTFCELSNGHYFLTPCNFDSNI